MSLAKALLASQLDQGPKCSFGVYLSGLPEAERAEWEEVLANKAIKHTTIERYVKENAVPVAKDAVARHRNGDCKCA